jgi:hypothetical protein
MIYSDFAKKMKKLFEEHSVTEDWGSLFKKTYTGDKTPNTITPKKEDTGEEQGQIYVKFQVMRQQNKIRIVYRHYSDPSKWSAYGYITMNNPNEYKKYIGLWQQERLKKNVRVLGGKCEFID